MTQMNADVHGLDPGHAEQVSILLLRVGVAPEFHKTPRAFDDAKSLIQDGRRDLGDSCAS
jgi:hypothetical protein